MPASADNVMVVIPSRQEAPHDVSDQPPAQPHALVLAEQIDLVEVAAAGTGADALRKADQLAGRRFDDDAEPRSIGLGKRLLPLRFTNRERRRTPHHRIRVSPGLHVESGQPRNVLRGRVAKRQRRERLAARLEALHILAPSTAAADRAASDRSGSRSARACRMAHARGRADAAPQPAPSSDAPGADGALEVAEAIAQLQTDRAASVPSTVNAAGSPVSGRSAVPSIESRPVLLSNVPRLIGARLPGRPFITAPATMPFSSARRSSST